MTQACDRVLLVDDEPSLLRMMSLYLVRLGFHVTTSATTDGAWIEWGSDPSGYRVAVLDASMEGLSMEELASRMLAASGRLCIIVTSGYPVDMSAMEATAPGRVMFLHKPFLPESLAAAVRRMLGSQEA
jgi:two-component system cell cycle sensor histidine kinase/response regulator CckA